MVGSSYTAGDAAVHAFLYDGTTMHDLGTLGGGYSDAYGINDAGQVVGESGFTVFLYDGTTMYDLNTLIPANSGWVLTQANAINDNGQIAGVGTIKGQEHAFLLTPISPATTFQVTAAASTVAGAPFDVTVTALDASGNVATGYTGTVHFTSADPYGATLPADYTFTAADQGTHTFSGGFTLVTPGDQTLTAVDAVNSTLSGSAVVTVGSPAPGAGSPWLAGQSQLSTLPGSALRVGEPSPVEVASVDRLFASLSLGNAGFVLFQPVHHARDGGDPWAPGPLWADEPLLI